MDEIEGVYRPGEISPDIFEVYKHGLPRGYSTGFRELDNYFRVLPGMLNIITGTPGSGKTTWLDQVLVNLAKNDITSALFTPESRPYELHVSSLLEKMYGKPFGPGEHERLTEDEVELGMAWLNKRFRYVHPDDFTANELLRKFEMCQREGCQIIVLDSWTNVDKERDFGQREDEFINKYLKRFLSFARETKVALFVIVHPRTMRRDKDGKIPVVTGYDLSGGAQFFNNADALLSIQRMYDEQNSSKVHVLKTKFRNIGRLTDVGIDFSYDRVTGIFSETHL